jgi:hypothetical protein
MQNCFSFVQSFLEEIRSVDFRSFGDRWCNCLDFEGCDFMIGASSFSDIELVVEGPNRRKYSWRVVNSSINQLFEEVGAWNIDLGCTFLLHLAHRPFL